MFRLVKESIEDSIVAQGQITGFGYALIALAVHVVVVSAVWYLLG